MLETSYRGQPCDLKCVFCGLGEFVSQWNKVSIAINFPELSDMSGPTE